MDIRVLFGRNLKIYRKKRQLSQEQLSEIVDISPMHLSKIERGLTFVSADLLEKLSETLETPVARLFCREHEQIYGDDVLKKFDRITEKHLIQAMEGIKGEIRQNDDED
jgi:transcriptional regulator with XRE-family HTH domain